MTVRTEEQRLPEGAASEGDLDRGPDRGPCLTLLSGRPFYPLDPRPEEVDFPDVAHQLAMSAVGGGEDFFSHAQRAVLLADQLPESLATESNQLTALLQGATYAYLPELPPVAAVLGPESLRASYQQARTAVRQAIFKAAGLPENPELLTDGRFRRFLKAQLRRERVLLGLERPAADERHREPDCWQWRRAEREFLQRYHRLRAKPPVVLNMRAGERR